MPAILFIGAFMLLVFGCQTGHKPGERHSTEDIVIDENSPSGSIGELTSNFHGYWSDKQTGEILVITSFHNYNLTRTWCHDVLYKENRNRPYKSTNSDTLHRQTLPISFYSHRTSQIDKHLLTVRNDTLICHNPDHSIQFFTRTDSNLIKCNQCSSAAKPLAFWRGDYIIVGCCITSTLYREGNEWWMEYVNGSEVGGRKTVYRINQYDETTGIASGIPIQCRYWENNPADGTFKEGVVPIDSTFEETLFQFKLTPFDGCYMVKEDEYGYIMSNCNRFSLSDTNLVHWDIRERHAMY